MSCLWRFINLTDVKDAGRGAIAREDLKVGDAALEIPASLIISEELLRESDMVFFSPNTLLKYFLFCVYHVFV